MAPAKRGLLDTSVFIASESGRRVDEARLPEEAVVSIVTVAELRAGILAASGPEIQSIRLLTLERIAKEGVVVLPVDVRAAEWWAVARVKLAQAGRRVNVNDLWIASTASAHGLAVVTQDADFDPIAEVMELATYAFRNSSQ